MADCLFRQTEPFGFNPLPFSHIRLILMNNDKGIRRRIVSLDQFRGYTVVGMLFVNFLGGYQVVPAVFKHHNTYCSYADTIMPQFFFAVGFAYRLTFLRRLASVGLLRAAAAVVKRNVGLILLGFVLYHLDGGAKHWSDLQNLGVHGVLAQAFRRELFQTLVHIALTSIWILPVIAAGARTRVIFTIVSAGLHLWLSRQFYFDWAWKTPVIDGGQLGFLTWTIPTLVGSLAYDAVGGGHDAPGLLTKLGGWSVLLMAMGYGLACCGGNLAAPPFVAPPTSHVVDLWTMSQRTGSISYLVFSTGFSLAVYTLFVLICDRWGWELPLFRIFGQNALAAYIIHPLVAGAVKPYLPNDAPDWFVAVGFSVYFGICTLLNRYLDKHELFLKL
jgi:predicted acyltransferase